MPTKTPLNPDASTKQFISDVVVPRLDDLDTALSTLITKDALELALLKERNEVSDKIDEKIKKAFSPWLKVFWIILTPIITGLVTLTVVGQLLNQGRLGQ